MLIGGDAVVELFAGVKVGKIKLGVFVVSGLLAAFAGVLDAAFIGYADGSFGATMELSAIAAAVLGGCHLAGGRISLIGTLLGAFMLRGIQSFLILLRRPTPMVILVAGLDRRPGEFGGSTLTGLALKEDINGWAACAKGTCTIDQSPVAWTERFYELRRGRRRTATLPESAYRLAPERQHLDDAAWRSLGNVLSDESYLLKAALQIESSLGKPEAGMGHRSGPSASGTGISSLPKVTVCRHTAIPR